MIHHFVVNKLPQPLELICISIEYLQKLTLIQGTLLTERSIKMSRNDIMATLNINIEYRWIYCYMNTTLSSRKDPTSGHQWSIIYYSHFWGTSRDSPLRKPFLCHLLYIPSLHLQMTCQTSSTSPGQLLPVLSS